LSVKFVKSILEIKNRPGLKLPEVVLCGRSNVGKSSFINSLFNKKNIAKTSSKPGKTETINYYEVGGKFYFVDLPGFGFARTSKEKKIFLGRAITEYLKNSGQIKFALHFIDGRLEPTKLDLQLKEFLSELNIPSKLIITKIDKLKLSEKAFLKKRLEKYFENLSENINLFYYSSVKGIGKKEIKKMIFEEFNLKI